MYNIYSPSLKILDNLIDLHKMINFKTSYGMKIGIFYSKIKKVYKKLISFYI